MQHDSFELRTANPGDLGEIVEVCSAALGWTNPSFDRQVFEWKHLQNPFGESLLLVAEDDEGIAAVRPFMHWEFRNEDGEVFSAVRAVDTATHPRAQGKGLFTALTKLGLTKLSEPGMAVDFIFNTPNEKSLAGYKKMGWVEHGRIEFGFGLRSPLSLPKLARSRTAAQKASIPTPEVGIAVAEGLSLLDHDNPCPTNGLLTTAHTVESLRWRYVESPIEYRFLPGPDRSGLIIRLRQRGASRELVVAQRCGHLDDNAAGASVRNALRRTKADYCVSEVGLGNTVSTTQPGPMLALKLLGARLSPNPSFSWQPGDIELF